MASTIAPDDEDHVAPVAGVRHAAVEGEEVGDLHGELHGDHRHGDADGEHVGG